MASRYERELAEKFGRDTFTAVFQMLDSCEELDTEIAGMCAANACFAVVMALTDYYRDESAPIPLIVE